MAMTIKNIIEFRFLFLLFLLASSFLTFGQSDFREGYVVLNSQDTLTGYINLRSNLLNSRECMFKRSAEAETVIYYPKDIQSYRLGNERYYITKLVNIADINSEVFLEYLVDGISDLFYLKMPKEDFYFIEGRDGSLIRLSSETKMISRKEEGYFGGQITYNINSNQYKRILTSIFRDSPETIQKIPAIDFTHEGLMEITKSYHENTCDWDCTLYGKKKKGLVYMEPIVGFRFSSQGLNINKDKASDQSAILGVNFRFTPFRIHYLWTWNIGLNYSNNSFDGDFGNIRSFKSPTRLKAEYKTIGLPLSIEYTVPLKAAKPFFNMGLEPTYLFNIDYLVRNSAITEDEQFRNLHLGGFLGAGLRRNLGSSYVKIIAQYAIRKPLLQRGFTFDHHYVSECRISVAFGLKVKGEGTEFVD